MTSVASPLVPRMQVFGDPQLHTDGELVTLCFAPDGSLWSVEEPGVLRHWSPAGEQLGWQSLSDLETLWCFSGDARVLASASNDLTLWDVSSGQVLTAIAQESWVAALAFHPDPTFLATGHDDGLVRCWDLAGHQILHTLRHHHKPISAAAFSNDGARLAVASEDKSISLWDTKTGTLLGLLPGHSDRIPALAWHPSGQWLISAGWDTTARIWDVAALQPAILLNTHSGQVTALALSADGKLLACADSGLAIHVWDFDARKTLHVLKGPQTEVRALAFSKDGAMLAANGDRLIHLWDPRTGQSRTGAAPRAGAKTTIALSPSGAAVASNGGGNAPRVWDTAKKVALFNLESPRPVHALAWSPDGKRIAGALGKHVRLWDAATGAVQADWVGPEDPITELAFSPDGTMLASAGITGLAVWLWRVADGEPILVIPDALDGCTVEALAFHPGGTRLAVGGIDWLATGGSNGAIALWDIPGRFEEAACFDGATALAMHPAGKHLAFATLEQSIGIWDFASQQLIDEFLGHDGPVTALAFSPDGKLLASGSEDRTLRLWNDNGDELVVADVDSQVTALVFSPDSHFLYTGNANTTCSLLKIADLLEKKS
ncbi:MAG: WD40 repeat domain-containing protein [Gemmataceae bacterium]|nr:WD40 repeat domain-containing protein [Gemmataceae bacterium]